MNIPILTVVRSSRSWILFSNCSELKVFYRLRQADSESLIHMDPFSTLKFIILRWQTKISIIWSILLLVFWLVGHRILSSIGILMCYFQLNKGFVSVYSTLPINLDNFTYRSHYHFPSPTTINIFITKKFHIIEISHLKINFLFRIRNNTKNHDWNEENKELISLNVYSSFVIQKIPSHYAKSV